MIPISFDTETFLITRKQPNPKNVCLTYCHNGDSDILIHGKDVIDFFIDLSTDKDILFVAINTAFDTCSLYRSYPKIRKLIFDLYKQGKFTDVAIRQKLFDIAIGRTYGNDTPNYSLAWLWEFLYEEKAPNWESKIQTNPDSWRLRYGELYNVPLEDWPQSAIEYALLDSEMVDTIYQTQETEAGNYFRDDTQQAYAAFCLNWMSLHGLRTSPKKTISFAREQQRIYDDLANKLSKHGLVEYNRKKDTYTKKKKPTVERIIKSCKQHKRLPLLTDKGKKLEKNGLLNPKDRNNYVATDKAAIYWSEDKLLLERIKFTEAEKMLSTYIPVLRRGYEFPISTRFNIAVTGRSTSKAPKEPLIGTNFQNWPRKTLARNCFIPIDGYVFLSADVSGAELHTLAQTCRDLFGWSTLGDALNDGMDVHLYVASIVKGISYAQAERLYKRGNEDINYYRFCGKMANFGFGGGMFGKTWAYQQLQRTGKIFTTEFGNTLRKHWITAWPETKKYFSYIKNTLKKNGGSYTIELPVSRRLTFTDRFTTFCNYGFQPRAADGTKRGLCEVVRRCKVDRQSYLYGCIPNNFIHDEIILSIPELSNNLDYRDNIVLEFKETFEEEFNIVVPDYPTTVEPKLMACWNKKAKQIIDSKGHYRVDRSN